MFGSFSAFATGFIILLASSRCISGLPFTTGGTEDVQLEGSSPISDPSAIWRRNSAGACKNLTDPKILPGWEKIKEYAKTHWGDKHHEVVTNDNHYVRRTMSPPLEC
ncbi:hypothetical protein F5890DRAFT_344083 [Lentinula detonsa]|uniref:Secreted protein n=1 Tax=Lentinula detonsa TaxID=2804962 RepID=A0AA38PWC9_9AGAR|nr:hypothetical protein F5890DRAFT_344083 [Lentinula detonsa]